ncbi:hypothetical protein PNI0153_00319 [Streptococcus pneumoniae PNI0153]|nr:hypothetical protein PNI0153_00319 [Streptococcus pneumoniae PNI0153]
MSMIKILITAIKNRYYPKKILSATITVLFLDGRFYFWIDPLLNNIYHYIKRHSF